MIVDYEAAIDLLLARVTIENVHRDRDRSLPELVSGYDVVKDAGIREMDAMCNELLAEMHAASSRAPGAGRKEKGGGPKSAA